MHNSNYNNQVDLFNLVISKVAASWKEIGDPRFKG